MTLGSTATLRHKSFALATLVLWLVSLHCCLFGDAGLSTGLCEMPEVPAEAPCHGPHPSSGTDGQPSGSGHEKLDCCDEVAMPLVTAKQALFAPVSTATLGFALLDLFPRVPVPVGAELIDRDTWPPGAAFLASQFIGSSLFGRAPPAVS